MNAFPFINTKHISEYTPGEYAQYLKSIISHNAKVIRDNKDKAKLRQDQFKPPKVIKYCSFRVTPKGKGVLTIRKRKPPYLYVRELDDLLRENLEHEDLVLEAIEKREIEVRKDPDE